MTVTWLQVWLDKVNVNAVRNQGFCTCDHHDVVLCCVVLCVCYAGTQLTPCSKSRETWQLPSLLFSLTVT
jgi:hypothetical protein